MSMKNGGPAFPLQSIGPEFAPGYAGMSLRDYFAAKAMQGLLAVELKPDVENEDLAEVAYAIADAMLAERNARRTRGDPMSVENELTSYEKNRLEAFKQKPRALQLQWFEVNKRDPLTSGPLIRAYREVLYGDENVDAEIHRP